MSELMDDIDGTVCRTVGFEVVRNDHRERIADYCREHGANFLQLLGLYVHMAAKPHGWKFSYRRLSKELPGVGDSAVRALLQHMAALGYYTVTSHRGDDGLIRGGAVFDAGNAWPAQTTVRQSTVRRNPTHGDSGVKLTDSDQTTTPTVRWSPGPGSPRHGGPTQLVSTEVVITESHSHEARQKTARPPDRPTPTHDMSDNDRATQFLNTLGVLIGHRIDPSPRAKAAAARALASRYDAPGALDAIANQGHDLTRAGPGLVLNLLEQLPQRIRDSWRDALPVECPHPGTDHLDRMPNLCWECRDEAGDPIARRRRLEVIA